MSDKTNDTPELLKDDYNMGDVGNMLNLLANKRNYPEIDPPNNKEYWLSAEEYNLLLDTLKIWIDDYNRRIGEITNPSSLPIIRTGELEEPTDNNIFSALRTLAELAKLSGSFLDSFISKKEDDFADGRITFKNGIQTGNWRSGYSGSEITNLGDAELNSLRIREWLEVPELRFNKVEVQMGEKWRSPGGGIIENVEILSADSGIITLKLEDGEYGAVSVNDLCTGIFNSLANSNNAKETTDDSRGNRTIQGFSTSYFQVTKILETDNSRFEYRLRPLSDTHARQIHPEKFANFAVFGNTTNKDRQNSVYETRTYQRFLINVKTWEYGFDNIAAQFGDLSNMAVHGHSIMEGYSVYLNNVYFSGKIMQVQMPKIINGYWYEYDYSCGDPDNPSCWINTGYKAVGSDGNPAYIGENGNWMVWNAELGRYVDSGDPARGDDGKSPEIRNGTWWVWDNEKQEWVNTGIRAEGTPGPPGLDAPQFIYLGAFIEEPVPVRNPYGGGLAFVDVEGIYHDADVGCYYRSLAFATAGNLYIWKYGRWVFWMKDGENGISPINVSITNEAVTIDKNNPSYAGTGTELAVWEGDHQLNYSVTEYGNGTRGAYMVDRSFTNITGGALSTSDGNMIAGNASNMTKDSAKIIYEIKGRRLDGKQFTFSKTQVFQKSGLDGVNSFKSTIFRRSVAIPTTPRGGSYNSPLPNPLEGWEDGIPEGKDPLYASTRIFSNTGAPPHQANWTKPGRIADTNEIQFRFSTVKNNPGNPTSNPNNWTSNSTPQAWWMAVRYLEVGSWSSWQVSKIRGEDGRDGTDTEFIYKYSEMKPARPVGNNHGWSFSPDIVLNNVTNVTVVSESHPTDYKWTKYGTSYKSPALGHNQETRLRLEITTSTTADVMMTIRASSAVGDFLYISELNAPSISNTVYKARVDNLGLKNVIFPRVGQGKHTVWVMYKKDATNSSNHDAGYVEPMGFQDIIWMSTRRYKDEVWTTWSDPVRYVNDTDFRESIYSKAVDTLPLIEGSDNIDDFLPNPCLPGKWRTAFVKTSSYDLGDCFKHNGDFYTCIQRYNGATNPVDNPATIPLVFKYTYPWTDDVSGVDGVAQYEYISTRDRQADGSWGTFTAPRLISRYGQDGEEADNYPIVFRGKWQSGTRYQGSLSRVDVVSVGEGSNLYYYTTKASVGGEFLSNINPVEDTLRWKAFPHSYISLATSLIVAEKANIGEFVIHQGKMVSQKGKTADGKPYDIAENSGDIPKDFTPYIRLDGRDGTSSIINAGRIGGFNISNEILTSSDGSSLILNGKIGSITAIKGNIASFILADQTLTSQDKTGGSPNLSMNGKTGEFSALNANIRGSFESNSAGHRITINKSTGEIRGLSTEEIMFKLGFSKASDPAWDLTSVFSLYTKSDIGAAYLETTYANGSLRFYHKGTGLTTTASGRVDIRGFSFSRYTGTGTVENIISADVMGSTTSVRIANLPTSSSGLIEGQLYREGNNLKIV